MAFTGVMACSLAKSPNATLFTEGSGGFVASAAASIATGRSNEFPGGIFTHWRSTPFHGALETRCMKKGRCVKTAASVTGIHSHLAVAVSTGLTNLRPLGPLPLT
jgi:hypothetical protein